MSPSALDRYANGLTDPIYRQLADDAGNITQDEAKKAIKSMGFLSKEEKAAIWQAQNKTWKPENPFHKKTGRAVYDALHDGDEED